jgi:hypothetical protein
MNKGVKRWVRQKLNKKEMKSELRNGLCEKRL